MQRSLLLAFCAAVALPFGSIAIGESVIEYNPGLGTFPESQGFARFQTLSPAAPIVTNGVFHQFPETDSSPQGYQYWYSTNATFDFSSTAYALEATLRVISSNYSPDGGGVPGVSRCGYYLGVTDTSGRSYLVGLASGGITIATDATTDPRQGGLPLKTFNTTNAFHTYRFVASSQGGDLFIDGALFASVPTGGTTRPDIANQVLFGDASHAGVSETELRLLRFQPLVTNLPPTVSCPATTNAECGSAVAIAAAVSDPDGDAVTVVWTLNGGGIQTNTVPASKPPAGTNVSFMGDLPLGTNVIGITVIDAATNVAFCSTTVVVVDTTPPVIGAATGNPSSLWPPDHKMVNVTIRADVTDTCGTAAWKIVNVNSSEQAEGNTSLDWIITGNHTLQLRAERSGQGEGNRIYSVTIQATDTSGNTSEKVVAVTVPHDKR